MSLTTIEQVRFGVGDITLPYVFTDKQIQHYLTSNSDNVSDTIDELQPIMLSALAARGGTYRTEDLYEDSSKTADNYAKAIEQVNKLKAQAVYPMIGGSSANDNDLSVGVDMFDNEMDYDSSNDTRDSSSFYNGTEDV